MNIFIDTANILSNDVLAFSMAGVPELDNLPQKERDSVLLKAIDVKIYERMPATVVMEFIMSNNLPTVAILSNVEAIAEQQMVWFEALSKHIKFDLMYCKPEDVLHSEETLVISHDRDLLVRQGKAGGRILRYDNERQFQFIINNLIESTD